MSKERKVRESRKPAQRHAGEISGLDDLFELLKSADGTASARSVAAYVEKHYADMLFMTASQVAQAAGVSQGSVSRFCSELGYGGYANFQATLRKVFGSGGTVSQRISRHAHEPQSARQESHERALNLDVESILALRNVLESKEYRKLVEYMAHADNLVLLSSRISATMLPYFEYTLSKLRPGVDLIQPGSQTWEYLSLRDPHRTVVLTTVFPRYSTQLVTKIAQLHNSGFTVLALTDSHLSPVRQYAKLVLCLPVVVSATFDNYAALASFFNIVLDDVVPLIPELSDRIEGIDRLEKSSGVYESSE
jgi:DNA-binding MurR/RpiR family transcriptional regulator